MDGTYENVAKDEMRDIAETIWASLRTTLEADPLPFSDQLVTDVQRAFNGMQHEFNSPVFASLRKMAAKSGSQVAAAVEAGALNFMGSLNTKYSAQIAIWVDQPAVG